MLAFCEPLPEGRPQVWAAKNHEKTLVSSKQKGRPHRRTDPTECVAPQQLRRRMKRRTPAGGCKAPAGPAPPPSAARWARPVSATRMRGRMRARAGTVMMGSRRCGRSRGRIAAYMQLTEMEISNRIPTCHLDPPGKKLGIEALPACSCLKAPQLSAKHFHTFCPVF